MVIRRCSTQGYSMPLMWWSMRKCTFAEVQVENFSMVICNTTAQVVTREGDRDQQQLILVAWSDSATFQRNEYGSQ